MEHWQVLLMMAMVQLVQNPVVFMKKKAGHVEQSLALLRVEQLRQRLPFTNPYPKHMLHKLESVVVRQEKQAPVVFVYE